MLVRLRKVAVSLVVLLFLTVGLFIQDIQAQEGYMSSGIEPAGIIRFAIIGDPHYGWLDVTDFYAHNIVEAWMFDDKFPKIDFAINLGDFVSGDYYDTEEEIERMWEYAMKDSFSHLFLPWVFAMGNHDVEKDMPNINTEQRVAIAKRETGVMERSYAFMYNNILFLVQGWKGEEGLSEDQKEWFQYVTSLYPDTTTVVICHAGPNEWWKQFFLEKPQIVLYLHGHGHNFRQYAVEGVTVVEYGHTNNSVSWAGKPWTGYVEITEESISGGVYDVIAQSWIDNLEFHINIQTGAKSTGLEWYSWSMFVEDGDTFTVDNRILAEEYYVELIGANPNVQSLEGASRDFTVNLNANTSLISRDLGRLEAQVFTLDSTSISNTLQFEVSIGGSRVGFIRVIYDRPILWSPSTSIGIVGITDHNYNCKFEQVARYISDEQVSFYPLRYGVMVKGANSVSVRNGYYTVWQIAAKNLPDAFQVLLDPVPPSPKVSLTSFVVPASVQQFQTFPVIITIQNLGRPVKVKAGISVDSEPQEFKYVVLGPNESAELYYYLEFKIPGEHEIAIIGQEPKTLTVVSGLPF